MDADPRGEPCQAYGERAKGETKPMSFVRPKLSNKKKPDLDTSPEGIAIQPTSLGEDAVDG